MVCGWSKRHNYGSIVAKGIAGGLIFFLLKDAFGVV